MRPHAQQTRALTRSRHVPSRAADTSRVREGAIIRPSPLMITCPALAPRAGHKRSLCPARTRGNTAPHAMAVKQHAHGLLPSRCFISMHMHGGGGQGGRRADARLACTFSVGCMASGPLHHARAGCISLLPHSIASLHHLLSSPPCIAAQRRHTASPHRPAHRIRLLPLRGRPALAACRRSQAAHGRPGRMAGRPGAAAAPVLRLRC